MGQRRGNVLAWAWISAALVLVVVADVSGRWRNGSPPLWWWILGAVVVGPGLLWLAFRLRTSDYDDHRWIGWWHVLPAVLRPFGVWATVTQLVLFGLVLPALGVLYVVEGNLAGKLIGAGLLGLSLGALVVAFRRRK